MSFIVTFNGQFKKYKLPESFHYEHVNHLERSQSNQKINKEDHTDFEEALKKTSSHKFEINAYKQTAKKDIQVTSYKAKDIMTHSLKTMNEFNTIKSAKSLMERNNIHHLPIMNDKDVFVGIISDRDLLKSKNDELKLIDIMQTEVIACFESTPIQTLASVMLHENIHCTPVLDEENLLIGIVTQADILKAILNANLLKTKA